MHLKFWVCAETNTITEQNSMESVTSYNYITYAVKNPLNKKNVKVLQQKPLKVTLPYTVKIISYFKKIFIKNVIVNKYINKYIVQ